MFLMWGHISRKKILWLQRSLPAENPDSASEVVFGNPIGRREKTR
jgi:hypothetical protein